MSSPRWAISATSFWDWEMTTVYDIVITIVDIQGVGPNTIERLLAPDKQKGTEQVVRYSSMPVETVRILPPGTWRAWISGHGVLGMGGRPGVDIAFVGRNGCAWIRRAKGFVR